MCINVLLPDPDGPITETNSPSSISRPTDRSACTSTSPIWYVFVKLRIEITDAIAKSSLVSIVGDHKGSELYEIPTFFGLCGSLFRGDRTAFWCIGGYLCI